MFSLLWGRLRIIAHFFLWFHSSSVASGLITRLKLNENISKLKRLPFFKNVWVFLLLFICYYSLFFTEKVIIYTEETRD